MTQRGGQEPRIHPAANADVGGSARSNLATIYQDFFIVVVRIQAKQQPLADMEAFRQKMKLAMRDAQRQATAAGYSSEVIRDAEFALVAFLDEVILTSRTAEADQWAKKTLSVELFGDAAAGDRFFDRLDALQAGPESAHAIDSMEVYLLCLLLGFEGRYALMKERVQPIAQALRERIERTRQPGRLLTPEAGIPDRAPETAGVPAAADPDRIARLAMAASLVAAVLCFALFKSLLYLDARGIAGMLRG